jgi:hypothetical protein
MKIYFKYLFISFSLLAASNAFSQVGIGTNTPAASAALEVSSTGNNKGILIPRVTATQKDAISNPSEGLMVYQTSAPAGFYYYTGTAWKLMVTQTDLDTKVSTVDAMLSLNTKVDKVTGKDLSSNDYTTTEKTKLSAITGSNTGDQDLSALATTASVALKANTADVTTSLASKVDKVTGKDLSSNDYTTTEKTKLAAIAGSNTGDQNLSALATIASVALKANTADVTTSLASKVDKVTGKDLSSNDYTTTEKTKLAAIAGSNTGDQNLSALATIASVALKANTADVNTDLATKVDKIIGKDLSSNDYTTTEKTKLAAISGINTGDQDLSALATIASVALKANITDVNTALSLKANTADVTNALALKANITDVNTDLALKANTAEVTNSLALKAPLASPSLVTPNIGVATGTSLSVSGQLTSTIETGTAPLVVSSTTPVANLSIGGNAATATTATNATNIGITDDAATATAVYPTFVDANTGNLPQKVSSTNLSFVPSTGTLSATNFSGSGAGLTGVTASGFLGTLPIANGGTGSTIGSITGSSALTFAAGGEDQNVTITPSGIGNTILNGNVGIGTTSPIEKLVVSKNAGATANTNNFLSVETVIDPLVNSSQGVLISKNDGTKRGFKLYQQGSDDSNSAFKIASFNNSIEADRFTIIRANGNVGIGTSSPHSTALLDVSSTTKGFLPPRMTGEQRNQIASPAIGLMVYCTNCGSTGGEPQYYNGSAWVNMIGGSAMRPPAIGDAYQGGIIAYIFGTQDLGYVTGEIHGLIAATSDQSTGIRWSNGANIPTGLTGTAIGTGLANTNTIIFNLGGTSTSYAAGLARAHNGGGYTDWYLPSEDELGKLYINRVAIGGFTISGYWSSTEIWGSYARYYPFTVDSSINVEEQFLSFSVRAIRAF